MQIYLPIAEVSVNAFLLLGMGTLVGMQGGDETLARDLAMHVAAANPQYVAPEDVRYNFIRWLNNDTFKM